MCCGFPASESWTQILDMDAYIQHSYTRTIRPVHHQHPADFLAQMTACAEELRQVVCIKVQDNNDLRTAGDPPLLYKHFLVQPVEI